MQTDFASDQPYSCQSLSSEQCPYWFFRLLPSKRPVSIPANEKQHIVNATIASICDGPNRITGSLQPLALGLPSGSYIRLGNVVYEIVIVMIDTGH